MTTRMLGTALIAFALLGCGNDSQQIERAASVDYAEADYLDAPSNEFGFAQAQSTGFDMGPSGQEAVERAARSAERATADAQGDVPQPQQAMIAYSYSHGFRVDTDNLAILQQRHVDLCTALADGCRILNQTQSGDENYGYGRIRMQVIASEAVAFNEQLNASTEGVDAERISYSVSGDDLTDNIIDTEAHLEGRRLLRDRLMEILRTRQGTVGDLVEAERGVAEVNEEIDAAASRLENLRGRVAFSQVAIEYDPQLGVTRLGFSRPIREAIESIGSTLGVTIAVLIYTLTALVPVTITILGLRWLWRKSGLKLWRRRSKPEAGPAPEEPASQ